MKEEVLHYLWKTKRLPFHQFTLTDGRKLEVIYTGTHNMESGPDFSNAKIKIDDLIWSGNIEIHVKASEWYTHNHQIDKAYDNVILHVVYYNDKAVEVQNEKIPTLELSQYISWKELNSIQKFVTSKKKVVCGQQINDIDPVFVVKQIESTLHQRLKRKATLIQKRYVELECDLKQVMIEWTAQVLGGKTNGLPMIELGKQLKYSSLLRENEVDRTMILFFLSGLLPNNLDEKELKVVQHYANKYQLTTMNPSAWKYFGLYSYSYPPFRILQFSHIIAQDMFFQFLSVDIYQWVEWWMDWQFQLPEFWQKHTSFSHKELKHTQSFSKQLKELVIINVVVPFLFWQGVYNHQYDKIEIAFELLGKLPAEQNNIIAYWKNLKINVKSAFESQGLLELINEFCNKKKCLSCIIGSKVLQNENNTEDCTIL
ncbi:MAG: DUF2851 family protein [Crocinitomicaceae bacterium]|nr:DUF2851 family protein [Crocinitomicaceae bacterium]